MNSLATAGTTARESQVQEQLNRLHKNVDRLREVRTSIIERLQRVSAGRPTTDKLDPRIPSPIAPEVALCGLADEIRTAQKAVDSVVNDLSEWLQSIEL